MGLPHKLGPSVGPSVEGADSRVAADTDSDVTVTVPGVVQSLQTTTAKKIKLSLLPSLSIQ